MIGQDPLCDHWKLTVRIGWALYKVHYGFWYLQREAQDLDLSIYLGRVDHFVFLFYDTAVCILSAYSPAYPG